MFADFDSNKNNDGFLDEFRQNLSNEPAETFEERKNEINRSKNVFVGTVSGIALAAAVGWFVLSPSYDNPANVDIPVIRRPQTAVKIQPAEPGGMEIRDQDKSVYDIIEKKEAAPIVENLLPPPEEPQLPTIAAVEETAPVINQAEEIIKTEETKEIKKVAEPQVVKQEAPQAPEITIAEAASTNVEKAIEIKEAPQTQPTSAPKTEAPKPQPESAPVAPTAETKVVVSGPWQVQLISSPNRQAVDKAWNDLCKKYPVLKNHQKEVETADLGSKGTFYRLKAGGFADRAGAESLCRDIKALGGTCIVKKK
ncbi:MAG: hypothetical protein E7018_04480 [Alphaproteobacteria bacterium]|nr:hypothetical protein [Alphaproteobacteria bacterium]